MTQKRKYLKDVVIVVLITIIVMGSIALISFWPDCPESSETITEKTPITITVHCPACPECPKCLKCPSCPSCPSEDPCADRTTPVLYEGEFPGTVKGPAIIEWWDGGPATAEHEGIFKLDVDEEDFKWEFYGHYWIFCSQEALETRYPDHMEEFFAKWPMDKEGRPPNQ